jgi:tetratricopeptide (TPR) repeat protein
VIVRLNPVWYALLLAVSLPVSADTLLIWSGDAPKDQVDVWSKRAANAVTWSVVALTYSSPEVKRAISSGRLSRSSLHPRDAMDLVLLGKSLDAEWTLLPGKKATLVSTETLQAAFIPLSENDVTDEKNLTSTIESMSRAEAGAGQWEALASRWINSGQADFALDTLQKAQEKEPGRPVTQALFVDAYRVKGDLKEAERFLKIALKQNADNPRLLRSAGELAVAQDNPQKALDAFRKIAAAGAATPSIHRLTGEAYLALGRTRYAEEEFRLAEGEPGVASARARLAAQRGAWSDVATQAARALEENPADWPVRLLLAHSLSAEGKYADAVNDRAQTLETAAEEDNSPTPAPLSLLQSAIRDQISDTINAVRNYQLRKKDRDRLYRAMQESVLAADRLRSSLQSRPDWHEDRISSKHALLALTLWSQASYDLLKALEQDDSAQLTERGEVLFDALRQLDASHRSEARPVVSSR